MYNIAGYTFIHNDRVDHRGGGVAIFIKNDIEFKIRSDLSAFFHNGVENIVIEIMNLNAKNIILASIYKPPETSIPTFTEDLGNALDLVNHENKLCYLAGDFNIDILKLDNQSIVHFINTLALYSCNPSFDIPTRVTNSSSTLIDNIFTNYCKDMKTGTITSDISDHYPVFIICANDILSSPYKVAFSHNTSFKNLEQLRLRLLDL